MVNYFVAIVMGALLGFGLYSAMELVPIKYHRVIYSMISGVAFAAIGVLAIPLTAHWRVHNTPSLSSESERAAVKASDELVKTLEKLSSRYK